MCAKDTVHVTPLSVARRQLCVCTEGSHMLKSHSPAEEEQAGCAAASDG